MATRTKEAAANTVENTVTVKDELAAKAEAKAFTKEELAASVKFSAHKDLLCAVLKDGERYTTADAESAIDNFLKGKVK